MQKKSLNYDDSDQFRHSVWKFTVIDCDEALKRLNLLLFN
jgi:hypothetical protein